MSVLSHERNVEDDTENALKTKSGTIEVAGRQSATCHTRPDITSPTDSGLKKVFQSANAVTGVGR